MKPAFGKKRSVSTSVQSRLRSLILLSALAAGSAGFAQSTREQFLDVDVTTPPVLIDGRISGYEIPDAVVFGG